MVVFGLEETEFVSLAGCVVCFNENVSVGVELSVEKHQSVPSWPRVTRPARVFWTDRGTSVT